MRGRRPIPEAWSEAEIDRTYHPLPSDNEWKKCTVGGVVQRGRRLWMFCVSCERHEYIESAPFVERYKIDPETPLLLLARRMRCKTCGIRVVHVREEPYSIRRDKLGIID